MTITLRHLAFTGPNEAVFVLKISEGLNLLYGASNTGKSFATKAIDYMLGGSKVLPDISERRPYDRAWLGVTTPAGDGTLSRALAGGNFALYPRLTFNKSGDDNGRVLGAKHDGTDGGNVSQFLLSQIGLTGCRLAVDANGKKRSLSFRDLARFCIVDETTIQSESSPVQSGSPVSQTTERSTFQAAADRH